MRRLVLLSAVGCSLFAVSQNTDSYVPSWELHFPLSQYYTLKSIDLDSARNTGLIYLNTLRAKAGMTPLQAESHLEQSALNHVNYIILNNIISHYENSTDQGFSGETPADRAVAAGYSSRYVLENLSTGQEDINQSIDDLFSAIYHRLAFLDETIDQLGIGAGESSNAAIRKVYVYNMGNSYLAQLCQNGGSSTISGSYYSNMCADTETRISVEDYNQALNSVASQNPQIILWPTPGQTDVPPVFYEEYPDPLPDYEVSGYPISIVFNRFKFQQLPTLTSFRIFRSSDHQEITDIRKLDAATDPNNHLKEYQYVLFPLQRLDWGTSYSVEITYHDNETDEDNILRWTFVTKALDVPYYKLDPDNLPDSIPVKADQDYAIYILPKNGRNITVTSFSYNADFQYHNIDSNTLQFRLSGSIGSYVEFSLSNGSSFKAIISDTDEAINSTPEEVNTTLQTFTQAQRETFDAIASAPENEWSLLGALDDLNVSDINSSYQIIWSYDGSWKGYSTNETLYNALLQNNIPLLHTLLKGKGFWIKK